MATEILPDIGLVIVAPVTLVKPAGDPVHAILYVSGVFVAVYGIVPVAPVPVLQTDAIADGVYRWYTRAYIHCCSRRADKARRREACR